MSRWKRIIATFLCVPVFIFILSSTVYAKDPEENAPKTNTGAFSAVIHFI